jgi:hypothetical protein
VFTEVGPQVDVEVAHQRGRGSGGADRPDDRRHIGIDGPGLRLAVEGPQRLGQFVIETHRCEPPKRDLPVRLERGVDPGLIVRISGQIRDRVERIREPFDIVGDRGTPNPFERTGDPPRRGVLVDQDAAEVEEDRSVARRTLVQWPIPTRCWVW